MPDSNSTPSTWPYIWLRRIFENLGPPPSEGGGSKMSKNISKSEFDGDSKYGTWTNFWEFRTPPPSEGGGSKNLNFDSTLKTMENTGKPMPDSNSTPSTWPYIWLRRIFENFGLPPLGGGGGQKCQKIFLSQNLMEIPNLALRRIFENFGPPPPPEGGGVPTSLTVRHEILT